MSSWKKRKLSTMADEVRDMFDPIKSKRLPYIGLEHIGQETLQFSGSGNSTDTISTKKHFKSGETLFGSLRPYFRKVVQPKFDGVCSTDITVIRPKPNCSSGFMKYFIANETFIAHASNISTGTRMPRANWKILCQSEWLFPPLSTQHKIAAILSAYDDLIENNLRRIKILEEMAQNLYREWFVKFRFPGHPNTRFVDSPLGKIPASWEATSFGNLVGIRKGRNITKKTAVEGTIPVVAGGLEPAYYHNVSNTKKPVITISASGANAGFVNIYYEDVWASDCSVIDRSATPYVYYFYLLLKQRQIEVTRLQRGSAQPHVYTKDLMALDTNGMPIGIVDNFHQKITPIFQMIQNLTLRNTTLRQTRDMLLPKLISGEIDVSALDIAIPEETAA